MVKSQYFLRQRIASSEIFLNGYVDYYNVHYMYSLFRRYSMYRNSLDTKISRRHRQCEKKNHVWLIDDHTNVKKQSSKGNKWIGKHRKLETPV